MNDARSPSTSRRSGRHLRGRGYTAVEVMISLALLGIGAAGVISMQRGTLLGVAHARNMDTANAIAHTWVERLRADATQWTLPNGNDPLSNDFGTTRFLNRGGTNMTDQGWYVPDQAFNSLGMSPAFDVLGRDLPYLTSPTTPTPVNPEVTFCTNVRIDCLVRTPVVTGTASTCSLMRTQVRVFWARSAMSTGVNDFCTQASISNVEAAAASYHFVYVVTALRQNTVR